MKTKKMKVVEYTSVEISPRTYLVLMEGEPVRIFSTAVNLDGAFDKVCQHVGQTLGCGQWEKYEADNDYDGAKPPSVLMALTGSREIWTVSVSREEV